MTLALHGKSRRRQSWLLAIAVAMVAFAALAGAGALLGGGSARAAAGTIIVSGNTSAAENLPGWMFNRDPGNVTPYQFNTAAAAVGAGSLYVQPIGANPADKFVGELFMLAPLSSVSSVSYDFRIGAGGTAADASQFYANVYANFAGSLPTKYYDCRYDIVPALGSTAAFSTVTFSPSASYPVTTRGGATPSPYPCPASPSGMDGLGGPGSTLRAFVINVGDTSPSDVGLDGYLDKVVVALTAGTTTYDFEPACTTVCYADAVNGNDGFGGASAANAKKTIQAAINQVNVGGIVNVAAGTYNEDVGVNKNVQLIGAGIDVSTIVGTMGDATLTTLEVSAAGAGSTIEGFTVTRAGNTVADWNTALNNQGVAIYGAGTTLRKSKVTGNRNGVFLYGAANVSIRNNTIDFNRTGIHLVNDVSGLIVQNNFITNNWTMGVLFRDESSPNPTGTVTITSNNISGNWYSQVEARSVFSAPVLNVTANWLGTIAPVVLVAPSSGEPGYSVQIPVAYGGAAVSPAGSPAIVYATNPVNYIPYLCSGVDASGATGFQPSPGSSPCPPPPPPCTAICYANAITGNDANTGVSPATAKKTIQAAINQVNAGGEVRAAAGTYPENITIPKALTLKGAGNFTKIIPAVSDPNCGGAGGGSLCAGASNIILVQADNVTIRQVLLDGNNPALTSTIVRMGADVDARNGIITNHPAGIFQNLTVHHVTVKNIYLRGMYASSGGSFNFHHNTVTNVQGDGSSIAMFNFGGGGIMANNTVSWANDSISSNWSTGVQFLNNRVTHSPSGIHTDNAGAADLIQGNRISACQTDGYGIFVFVPYVAPTIKNNTVTGCAVAFSAWGGALPVTTLVVNNEFDGAGAPVSAPNTSDGVYVTTDQIGYGDGNVSVALTNNSIRNFAFGLQVTQKNGSTATVTVDKSLVAKNGIGLENEGSTLNVTRTCVDRNTTGFASQDLGTNLATTVAHQSSITRNALFGANNTGANVMNAELNWWGSFFGPMLVGANKINSVAKVDGVPFLTWQNGACQFSDHGVGAGDLGDGHPDDDDDHGHGDGDGNHHYGGWHWGPWRWGGR